MVSCAGAADISRRSRHQPWPQAVGGMFKSAQDSRRCSKLVNPCRVVHQDLLSDLWIRRPHRMLVQQTSVIDLERRRHVGRRPPGRHEPVRMRPVRAPDNAVGIRGNQGLGERHDVGIARREFGRVPFGVTVDVCMAISGAGWHLEVHARSRLGCLGDPSLLHPQATIAEEFSPAGILSADVTGELGRCHPSRLAASASSPL